MATRLPGLTRRAAQAITRLMDTLPEHMKEGYLPVVTWISESPDSNFVPGPHIGGIKREDVPQEYILESHGVWFAYNIDPAILSRYESSALDFLEGQFIFIDKSIRAFVE
jgi:hypothetical protein